MTEPTVVSPDVVLTTAATRGLAESGVTVLDREPDAEPTFPLADVAADFATYGLRAESVALLRVDWFPQLGEYQPEVYGERLVWAVSVDTTGSTEEDLFPRDAVEAVAIVDANDGTLQTVFTN